MFNFIKKQKAVLVAIIVALLGWAGFTVTKEQVTPVVDKSIEITEDATIAVKEMREKKETETEQQPQEESESQETPEVTPDFNRASAITPERRTHILYGDATGGGHLYGTGAPCKSEFPKHWGEDTIIEEVEIIAANDNLNWRQQRNGYYVAEQDVGTVRIRVVKGRQNEKVITAYPTNVPRNPCPSNDG
ncbi:MAG: EndoU domain-containing protein [Pseudomonadota bacterium]